MATARELELACPACDGPGIYAMEDGLRLRVGLTSNLSRFVRRQRTPVRILYIVRLEAGKAPRAWRALLSHLRAQGLVPRECQFEAGAAHDVARSMARAARRGSILAASDIRRLAGRAGMRRSRPSPDKNDSVASTSVASTAMDSSPNSRPSFHSALAALGEESLPPTFRKVLGDIGADE